MGLDVTAERERLKSEEAIRAEIEARKKEKEDAKKAYKDFVDEEIAKTKRATALHDQWICSQCGSPSRPKTYTKGSFLVELFLWLAAIVSVWFFFPAVLVPIIYSGWRLTSRFKACPSCRGHMVRGDTPVGKKLLDQSAANSRS